MSELVRTRLSFAQVVGASIKYSPINSLQKTVFHSNEQRLRQQVCTMVLFVLEKYVGSQGVMPSSHVRGYSQLLPPFFVSSGIR